LFPFDEIRYYNYTLNKNNKTDRSQVSKIEQKKRQIFDKLGKAIQVAGNDLDPLLEGWRREICYTTTRRIA